MNLHVSIAGNDVTDLTLFETSIQKDATDAISTATLKFLVDFDRRARYDDGTSKYDTVGTTYAFAPREWQEVILTDDSAVRQFAGYITKIEREQVEGNITKYVCTCSDYGILLDRHTINETYVNETDEDIILDAFSGFTGVTVDAADIALIVSDLATFEAKDITLRELMERICELTGGEWRVDYDGALQYYASGSIAAPFNLSDDPDGVTTFAHGVTGLTRDFSAAANLITVLGGLTDGGEEITASARNLQSQATYGILSATVVDRSIPDQATADLRASAEISQRAFPLINGRAVTWKDGLDVGQTISIQNRPYGINGNYIIRSISIKFIRPGDALSASVESRCEYEIEFGQKIPDLVSALRRLERRTRQSTTVPIAQPAPLSVQPGSLAGTLTRFYLVSAEPVGAAWDQYDDDATFYNTSDGKVYRRLGGDNSWTAAVETVDLDGTITETQIADDSISTPKLQALSIVAGKLAANSVTAGNLAADSVIAGTVAAGAIRAVDAAFDTAAIQNADINSLSATKLTAGTIDASVITVTNLNASNITTGTLSGTMLANGTVADIKIASGLSATKLTTGTLDASIVTVTNLSASSITTGGMSAARITSGTIDASVITVTNLNATNITTGTMSATRIGAGTISASVSLTSPTITVTSGVYTVNIDATNKVKVTDTSIGFNTVMNGSSVKCSSNSNANQYVVIGSTSLTAQVNSGNASLVTVGAFGSGSLITMHTLAGSSYLEFDSSAPILGSSALPATPTGYLQVYISGTLRKIPFYV